MATFTAADLEQLKAKGISQERVEAQLECFRTGFPYLKIDSPSSLGHGIAPVDADLENACLARWNDFLADGGDVLKFVPASGAASRMFKALFAFVNGTESVPAEGSPVAQLVERIGDFAFYKELEAATIRLYGKTPTELVKEGRFKELVEGGSQVSYEDVLANVVHRDHIDTTRAESPLRRADDAIALDNSDMTLDEQDAWLLDKFNKATTR